MIAGGNSELSEACVKDSAAPGDRTTVAVIIPTFNQARFLPDSIMSVLAQTRPADEIIVVDDGSNDDPASVVAKFPTVQFIRQRNRGPSAARNTGLRNCRASHVVFLDADDRLLPMALEAGLMRIASRPDCAFVYGGFRVISKDGRPISHDRFTPIEGDSFHALLHANLPIIPSTALFRRDCLLAVNGFDETLRRCEDYDLFLNIAQRYPVASHPEIVAEYRRHGQNVSDNHVAMLKAELAVRHRYEARIRPNALARAHFRDGRAGMTNGRVNAMLRGSYARWSTHHKVGPLARDLVQAARWAPLFTIRLLLGALGRRASEVLPPRIVHWIERVRGRPYPIAFGTLRVGDLRRVSAIMRGSGRDNGTPVDRYYIEGFLARNAGDIRGRVLEAGENLYTRRFGGARVARSDVLGIEATSPDATFVGDLARQGALPEAAFDCVILTHALQYVFDTRAAVATLYRALKPGGVLLVTAPGMSQREHKPRTWYWTFTVSAVRRLLEEQFGQDATTVEAHGNVFAAAALLYGIAVEELDISDLNVDHANYPVVVAARVIKRKDA